MQKAFDLIVERLECESYFGWDNVRVVDVVDAVTIVNQVAEEYKQFGNSEQSEACEWKRELITTYIKPTCVNGKYFEYEDMEYCPYCGEKIKVVE